MPFLTKCVEKFAKRASLCDESTSMCDAKCVSRVMISVCLLIMCGRQITLQSPSQRALLNASHGGGPITMRFVMTFGITNAPFCCAPWVALDIKKFPNHHGLNLIHWQCGVWTCPHDRTLVIMWACQHEVPLKDGSSGWHECSPIVVPSWEAPWELSKIPWAMSNYVDKSSPKEVPSWEAPWELNKIPMVHEQ